MSEPEPEAVKETYNNSGQMEIESIKALKEEEGTKLVREEEANKSLIHLAPPKELNFAFQVHVRENAFFAGFPIKLAEKARLEFESFDNKIIDLKGQAHIKIRHPKVILSLTMKNVESISLYKPTNASHPSCIILHLRLSCGSKLKDQFLAAGELDSHLQTSGISDPAFAVRQLIFMLREELPDRQVVTVTKRNGVPVHECGKVDKLSTLLSHEVRNRLKHEKIKPKRSRDGTQAIEQIGEKLNEEAFQVLLEQLSMDFDMREGLTSKAKSTADPPPALSNPSLLHQSNHTPAILKKPQQQRGPFSNGNGPIQFYPAGRVPAPQLPPIILTNPNATVGEVLLQNKFKKIKVNQAVLKQAQMEQHSKVTTPVPQTMQMTSNVKIVLAQSADSMSPMSVLAAVAEHASSLPSSVPSTSVSPAPVVMQAPFKQMVPRHVNRGQIRRQRPDPEVVTFDDESEGDQDEQTTSNGGQPPEKKVKNNNELFQYPPTGREKMTVHYEDLKGLNFNEMLNDTIIDFYLRYIQNQFVPEMSRDRIHIMSSFFYKRLIEKAQMRMFGTTLKATDARFRHVSAMYRQYVRNWTKKIDIFSKDYIVVPIVDEMHWYMVIIVRPRLAVTDTMEEREEDKIKSRRRGTQRENPESYVVILDSLPDDDDPKRQCTVDVIRDYLELEFEDKKPLQGKFDRTRLGALVPKNLPRQMNYVDCGLFLLKYAQDILKDPPTQEELPNFDWVEKYPNFVITQAFYRDTIKSCVQSHCTPERWREYLEWLKLNPNQWGSGDSPSTIQENIEAEILDRARRPRRYSEIHRDHTHHLSGRLSRHGNEIRTRRWSSLPARLDFVDRSKLHAKHEE